MVYNTGNSEDDQINWFIHTFNWWVLGTMQHARDKREEGVHSLSVTYLTTYIYLKYIVTTSKNGLCWTVEIP